MNSSIDKFDVVDQVYGYDDWGGTSSLLADMVWRCQRNCGPWLFNVTWYSTYSIISRKTTSCDNHRRFEHGACARTEVKLSYFGARYTSKSIQSWQYDRIRFFVQQATRPHGRVATSKNLGKIVYHSTCYWDIWARQAENTIDLSTRKATWLHGRSAQGAWAVIETLGARPEVNSKVSCIVLHCRPYGWHGHNIRYFVFQAYMKIRPTPQGLVFWR